ncbi:hypothetical protein WN51_01909 [Melipona quadrifasciata]|uniref:Uncharacterized protein n=1 Tax=Melipona quadrifasciata TaxID=166423 RepID=A0A0N0BF62_9HYME|nr:hypothetical protein WN51_01909 [Melipona quadrifasciata]
MWIQIRNGRNDNDQVSTTVLYYCKEKFYVRANTLYKRAAQIEVCVFENHQIYERACPKLPIDRCTELSNQRPSDMAPM